jgi:hypothetical protein
MALLQLPVKAPARVNSTFAVEAFAQSQQLPLVRAIAEIGIRAERPDQLFAFFTQALGLPVTSRSSSGGSFSLGNLTLEIGTGPASAMGGITRSHTLALASNGQPLAEIAETLRARGILHTAPLARVAQPAPERAPALRQTRLYLGGLLDDTVWASSLFFLSRVASIGTAAQTAPGLGAALQQLLDRSFPDGVVCFTQGLDSYRQRATGGPLGIVRAQEVRVGVLDVVSASARWGRLLEPHTSQSRGCWQIGEGPALRLVSCKRAGIQLLVLQVRALAAARAYLAERGLLGFYTDDELTLRLPQAPDLHIRLVER